MNHFKSFMLGPMVVEKCQQWRSCKKSAVSLNFMKVRPRDLDTQTKIRIVLPFRRELAPFGAELNNSTMGSWRTILFMETGLQAGLEPALRCGPF